MIIIIVVSLIFGIFYLITTLLVDEDTENKIENENSVVVDNTKITLGQLLTRTEEKYYVLATMPSLYSKSYIKTDYIEIYNNYINKYKSKENSIKFYYIDLDDALNKKYVNDELNIDDDISKLSLNDEVLFKIENGKIVKYYVGKDQIIEKLSKI